MHRKGSYLAPKPASGVLFSRRRHLSADLSGVAQAKSEVLTKVDGDDIEHRALSAVGGIENLTSSIEHREYFNPLRRLGRPVSPVSTKGCKKVCHK